MSAADSTLIANIILKGFNRHYTLFQRITREAKHFFQGRQWRAFQKASAERISYYDQRVLETVARLRKHLNADEQDPFLWQEVKRDYVEHLAFHPQAELAETFYNSVFCNLFHREYFNNDNIFITSTLEDRLPAPKESVYKSYFPFVKGLKQTIRSIVDELDFDNAFVDKGRDINLLIKAFRHQSIHGEYGIHQLRFDIPSCVFYRNKAAYVIGRVVSPAGTQPFILPILTNEKGELYFDTLITDVNQVAVIFGHSRAYFMVETPVPSALVHFLHELLPHKTKAELYSSIGLHKQGKTEFYRDFLRHLADASDELVVAPGVKGMVMAVFTLPSFPYVFKVIRDKFSPSKEVSRQDVLDRYLLVKKHDRVGRMADTMEFSDVAFPLSRFSDELLQELKDTTASSLEFEGDLLTIKHLYVERRMTPLNIFMDHASPEEIEDVLFDYGLAIKEMIAANIFPGDMLLKNFGLTRHNRVVFYDYDEVQYLLDINFRKIPEARYPEDELAAEPWYSVGPNDVFPEELSTFVSAQFHVRDLFERLHPELLEAEYWQERQQKIRDGHMHNIFPYPKHMRFKHVMKS